MNIDDSAGMPKDGGGAALEGGIVRTLAISIATSTAAVSVSTRLQRKAALAAVSAVAFHHCVGTTVPSSGHTRPALAETDF